MPKVWVSEPRSKATHFGVLGNPNGLDTWLFRLARFDCKSKLSQNSKHVMQSTVHITD